MSKEKVLQPKPRTPEEARRFRDLLEKARRNREAIRQRSGEVDVEALVRLDPDDH